MKKLFLTLAMAVISMAAMAQQEYRWAGPENYVYPDETPLYVVLTIDEPAGPVEPQISEIAAFIDGECRDTMSVRSYPGGYYTLRVHGNSAIDAGKTITIKALYKGLVYTLSTTQKFDGEAHRLALTLQPLLEVDLDEKPIEMELGGDTYNMSTHVVYKYGEALAEATVSPIDETETPLTVSYGLGLQSEEGYITVASKSGVIEALQVTDGAYVTARVAVTGATDEYGNTPNFDKTTTVVVAQPKVTSIVVSPTTVNVLVGETLGGIIQEGRLSISMLPANANQGYDWIQNGQNPLPWDGNYNFTTAGTFTAKVYSTSTREVDPVVVTFVVSEPLTLQVGDGANGGMIGMIEPLVFNVYMNTSDGFDAALLTVEPYNNKSFPIAPFEYQIGAVQEDEAQSRYYVPVTMTGRYYGPFEFNVLYNGNILNETGVLAATICPEIAIKSGWQWVSPYAYEDGNEYGDFVTAGKYQDWVTEGIVEMRTQDKLLYIDPQYGPFGDLTAFSYHNGMYKVKAKAARTMRLCSNPQEYWYKATNFGAVYSEPGYKWFVFPFEFNLGINEVGGLNGAYEGDQIIAYGGAFAEYSNGAWVPNDFTFQAGAGYMYFNNSTETIPLELTFNIGETVPACYQPQANPVKGEVDFETKTIAPAWEVEEGKFADVMTIVAQIPGLTDADAWTLGAFVNGECRGQGRIVKDDILFVGLMGKGGEKIRFRLHNNFTGEEFDLEEVLTFTNKAGSLKAPVRINADEATGITVLATDKQQKADEIYDMSGRRVVKPVKGIYVVNGKKVIY